MAGVTPNSNNNHSHITHRSSQSTSDPSSSRRGSEDTFYDGYVSDTANAEAMEEGGLHRPSSWDKVQMFVDGYVGESGDDSEAQQSNYLDRSDPSVTHAGINHLDEKRARSVFSTGQPSTEAALSVERHRRRFILKLAKCLLAFSAPAHRMEAKLESTAKALDITATFFNLGNIIIVNFTSALDSRGSTSIIRARGALNLAKLDDTDEVYRAVAKGEMSAEEGGAALDDVFHAPLCYGRKTRCLIAFMCGAVIAPLAFQGSTIDSIAAGTCSLGLSLLHIYIAPKSVVLGNVYELLASFIISFVARGLYSIHPHKLCFSAINSGGIVLILPGFSAMCAALEIVSRSILTGSLKLVYSIVYALFLGFLQTIGSDFFFVVDSSVRNERANMISNLTAPIWSAGDFVLVNKTISESPVSATLVFDQVFSQTKPYDQYHYLGKGCYRSSDWEWYWQTAPAWTYFFLVPMFTCLLALWNLQPIKGQKITIICMVLFGCASFSSNYYATMAATKFNQISATGSTIGALAVGLLGHIYSRVRGVGAFAPVIPGILLLVPSGLTIVGGLAKNYQGGTDQYTSGLTVGLGMIQVSIGITLGLLISGCIAQGYDWFAEHSKHGFGSRGRDAMQKEAKKAKLMLLAF